MTDFPPENELSEADQAHLAALLGGSAVWDETSQINEDAIVAAILAELPTPLESAPMPEPTNVPETPNFEVVAPAVMPTAEPELPANVIAISRSRRWFAPIAAGIAAGLIVVAGFAFGFSGSGADGVPFALAGTDNAPGASAEATVAVLQSGTRIILDVSGLPPAEPGTYYEAWMRIDAETGVSAGTFHLRGGDGTIELWSGVLPSGYPLITVTLQNEAQTESSGVVVLKGLLDVEDFDS